MRRLVAALLVLAPVYLFAQAKAPSIEGVWKVTSVVATGAGAASNTSPQPSLVIFTKGYYSYTSLAGTAPRAAATPAKDPAKPTAAEALALYAMWNPLTAQAGTYQLAGNTLTRRPTVAKNVAVMTTNPPIVQQARLEGNKLTLVAKSAAGQPVSETTTTLMRVE
jgi:hypothetical protein